MEAGRNSIGNEDLYIGLGRNCTGSRLSVERGSEDDPIRINSIHFDGCKHYRRNIDRRRIVERLTGLRDYCSISSASDVIYDGSSYHGRDDAQSYDDCQLLQLTDLLIGCFRSILIQPTRDLHRTIAYPIESLIQRYSKGYARMQQSKWKSSFCMSECHLEQDKWVFNTIEIETNDKSDQIELPFK